MDNEIISKIQKLIDTNYIKKGWFDNDIINLFNNDDLIKCINDCSSPSPNKDDFKNKEDFMVEKLKLIFKAFSLFEPSKTRVLILGQDPYPNPKKAQGLAFSHKSWEKVDASLLNIFRAIKLHKDKQYFKKENEKEYKTIFNKIDVEWETDLTIWASKNGILLLNTALTYCDNISKEDRIKIWEPFIQEIIIKLLTCDNSKLVVFLWGDDAQNTFLRVINNMEYKANIETKLKPKNKAIVYKNNQEKLKINDELIRAVVNINMKNCEYKLFMTSHPSNNFQSVKKGFSEDTPDHFEACDKFLFGEDEKNYIWKNFPENNEEQYYKNK